MSDDPTCCTPVPVVERAVHRFWSELEGPVSRLARRISDDDDLRADLIQEAWIALWELDPTRIDLEPAVQRMYLCRVLKNRVWKVWRAHVRRTPRLMHLLSGRRGPLSARWVMTQLRRLNVLREQDVNHTPELVGELFVMSDAPREPRSHPVIT